MKKQAVDILFFVEHVAREFDIACLVSAYFQKQHPQVSIKIASALYSTASTIAAFQPKVVVTPYCYDVDSYIYKYLLPVYGDSVHYVNLACEQICTGSNVTRKMPKDRFARQGVTHVVWSEAFAGHMRESGTLPQNIHVNGNPGFSLYQSPYRECSPSRAELAQEFNLDVDKKWLFIPGNFGPAFWSEDKRCRKMREGLSEDYVNGHSAFSRATLQKVLAWLGSTSLRDAFEFILRPKPSVPLAEYCEFVEAHCENKAVRVLKDYSIREWILASDYVASNFSTSLIDAAIAEKPVALLEPLPLSAEKTADWHNQLEHLHNQTDFDAYLQGSRIGEHARLKAWAEAYTNEQSIAGLAGIVNKLLNRPAVSAGELGFLEQNRRWLEDPVRARDMDFFSEQDVDCCVTKWAGCIRV